MKIKSTLAWGALMLASAVGGTLGERVTWFGEGGTYAARPWHVAVWACPEDAPDMVPVVLGCPVDMSPAYIRTAAS